MQSYPMLIAGRAVDFTEQDDVINPATGVAAITPWVVNAKK